MNKLKKENFELEIQNDMKIIGFRNRIIHAYDSIDDAIVWAILKRHIPKLKTEINRME